jgi:hypothetical protein
LSTIKHVTLPKIFAHDFRYSPSITAFPFILGTEVSWVTGKEILFKKTLGLLFVVVSINPHG